MEKINAVITGVGVDGQLDTGFLSVIPVENSLKDGK